MKRFLLTLFLFVFVASADKIWAQCTVSDPTLTDVRLTPNGSGTCTLSFDLSFTMENNNGNKTIVIHLWPADAYPSLNLGGDAPDASDLAGSYGSIVINNDVLNPSYYSTYPFSSGVTILSTNPSIVRTGGNGTPYQFTILDVIIPNANCSGTTSVKGDVWSTNAGSLNSNTNPQCWTQNLNLVIGDPTLSQPVKICDDPRGISFEISATSQSSIDVTYEIHEDDNVMVNNQFVYNAATDVDVTLGGTQEVSVSADVPYTATNQGFVGNDEPGESSNYWVVVSYQPPSGGSYSIAKITQNYCTPLPVLLKVFSAQRQKKSVALKWETATEINNRGFQVQRNSRGVWETITFVPSAATDGNSSGPLTYSYQDLNEEKGVTQYRLRQVDIDGRAMFSPIRSVRGLEQVARTIVYPNPSHTGRVNVVFEDSGPKEVTVSDMSGRVVRRYRSVVNNQLIEGLDRGVYSIRITDLSSAASNVEKVIIK